MNTKIALGFVATAATAGLATACSEKKDPRPNVILIITDQHRFDYIGSVNDQIITPNIDQLSTDGNRFAYGYTAAPSSTPARAGLLTGQTPYHHGLLGYSNKICSTYQHVMPKMLADAGYHTAAVGKMHWYPQKNLHGLHELYVDESGRVESDGFESDYRQWFNLVAPNLNPDSLGIGWNDHAAGIFPLADSLHPTAWTAMKSIDVIDKYDKTKPLFLKVSFARPHSPYDPPQKYFDMYENSEIDGPVHAEWSDEFAKYPPNPSAAFGYYGDDYAINSRKHYAASITFIDDELGKIIQKLKDEGLYENSVIVFSSDHGDMLGDHNHWRKTYAYEGSAHIPYIVKMPSSMQKQVKPGEVVYRTAELRDVLPTFLEAAEVEIPAEVDGLSLYEPIRNGENAEWREYIDMEHADTYRANSAWVALTDGKLKYIWNYADGNEIYFDLTVDPLEVTNIATDPSRQEEMAMWRKRMVNHLEERGETFVKNGELQKRPSMLFGPNFKRNK